MNPLTTQEVEDLNEAIPALSRESQIKEGKFPPRGLGDLLQELTSSGSGDYVEKDIVVIGSKNFTLTLSTKSKKQAIFRLNFDGSEFQVGSPASQISQETDIEKGTVLFSKHDGIEDYIIVQTDPSGVFKCRITGGTDDMGPTWMGYFKILPFPGEGLLDGDAFSYNFIGV